MAVGTAPLTVGERRARALRMARAHYWAQLRSQPRDALPGMLLPGIGNMVGFYGPPLVVARVLHAYEGGATPSPSELTGYLVAFAGLWLAGEMLWRIGI